MPVLYAISIDSGSAAQNARIRNEMEQALGCHCDPLELLLAAEAGDLEAQIALDPTAPEFDEDVLFWCGVR